MINELIKRFVIEERKGDRSGAYGYTQRKMAFNSNRIEGSKLTEIQTASIFETGTLRADGTVFCAKDVEEATGHFIMFKYMLKTYMDLLSESLIKQYHFKLKSGVFEDAFNGYPVGEYKNRKNMVFDIITSSPENVSEDIRNLLS